MIPIQNTKTLIMVPPELKDNGDYTTNNYVDTLGWDHLRVLWIVGTLDTTIGSTAEGSAPKVEECDTTDGTYTDITGAALADSIAATEDDKIFCVDVDLHGCKRYLEVDPPHCGDGTTGACLCIIGILSRGETAPNTAAEAGFVEHIKA